MNFSSHDGEIPIPIPITSTNFHLGGGAHCQSQINCIGPPPPPPPPETLTPLSLQTPDNSKKGIAVKYRECLKNHAASIGGNATDGCGEFMPSGKEGTLEALKCSACHCHRNFHRKETEGISSSSCDCFHFKGGRKMEGYISRPSPPHHQMIMPLGALQTSESDDMEGFMTRTPMVKKRFRTKFSAEQKEKMLGFAEKVGWRLQKQEESLVQQFCQEIGIKRRVLKVWMHNNKHNLAKKSRNLQLDWSTSTTTVTDL